MAQQDAFTLSRSNLNGFLFADIGIERSGMPLSVISALAREGFDPWQEAERLAKQPRKMATDGLARLIAAMPASLWSLPDATAIATRLVVLLPGRGNPDEDPQPAVGPTFHASPTSTKSGPWLILAILTILSLAGLAVVIAPRPAGPAATPPTMAAPINPVPTGD